jgi:hypothetical protein
MTEAPDAGDAGSRVSRRRVLQATGAVALGGVAVTGSASAHACCVDCERLGKVDRTPEKGDRYEFDYTEGTITISVVDVAEADGEVTCARLDVEGGSLCKVVVKGGPGNRVREYDPADCECDTRWCGTTSTYPCAPFNENSGKLYEISNITFYACLTETRDGADDPPEEGGDHRDDRGARGRGRGPPDRGEENEGGNPGRGRGPKRGRRGRR